MFLPRLTLLSLLVISFPAVASAKTLRVPADFPAIQRAIDAAAPGDVVLVSAGTYAERLQLKSGVIVKSDGDDAAGKQGLLRAEATILDGANAAGEGSAVIMAEGAVLDGLTIQNFGKYDDALWQRHYETHGNEQSHEHIGASTGPGVQIPDVTCVVRNNIVHHIGDTGIGLFGSPGSVAAPHVFRNTCYRNMGGGIGAMKESLGVIEENRCFENFYAGIGHDHASPLVINNVCYANIRAGIGVSEGACPTVRGNKCYQNRRAGIGVRTGEDTRPIVEQNECYDNDMAGIGAEEEAAPIIRENKCYRNKLAGIGVRDAHATILGNESYENGKAGIGLDAAVALVADNHCHANQTAGIGLAECESGAATLLRNKVIDNAQVAVGIHPGWKAELLDNELARAGGLPPIVMVFAGSEATLVRNVIRGGGVAAVRVAGQVRIDQCQLLGAEIRAVGPPNFAVWALPGSSVQLTDNRIDNWRHALVAEKSHAAVARNEIQRFHQTPFVLKAPAAPVALVRNQIHITNPKDPIYRLEGAEPQQVIDQENKVVVGAR